MYTINDIDQVLKPLNEFKAVIVLYGKDHSGKTLTLEQVPKFFANVRQNHVCPVKVPDGLYKV